MNNVSTRNRFWSDIHSNYRNIGPPLIPIIKEEQKEEREKETARINIYRNPESEEPENY